MNCITYPLASATPFILVLLAFMSGIVLMAVYLSIAGVFKRQLLASRLLDACGDYDIARQQIETIRGENELLQAEADARFRRALRIVDGGKPLHFESNYTEPV